MRRFLLIAAALAVLGSVLGACTSGSSHPSAQVQEQSRQQHGYAHLVAAEPAHSMSYSPTRQTINFWIDTWDHPNKLAFVYLIAANGQKLGYYVFDGPPVNMCAALTPTYRKTSLDLGEYGGETVVPAPSVDGVYYSGGQCASFYGKDATTGAYMEFSTGSGINYLLYDQPLHLPDVQPLGFTTVADVKGRT